MAALTAGRAREGTVPIPGLRAALVGALRSEVTKIRSVRSTYWTLILLVLASVAWSIANCAGEASRWSQLAAQDKVGFDPVQASILGLASLGQLIIIAEIIRTAPGQISTHMFSAWGELAVFGAYTVVVLAAGAVLFLHRDA